MQKLIKNESLQGLELHLATSNGVKTHWLAPQEFLVVPANWLTPSVINLNKYNLLRITNY